MTLNPLSPTFRVGVLILLILTGLAVCHHLHCEGWLTLESVQEHFALLMAWRENNYWLAVALFVLVYVLAVTLSLPAGALLTLTGGALFGYAGVLYSAVASALGAVAGALVARFFLRGFFETHCGGPMHAFNTALEKNKITYLLHVRLTPIYPFFLVNALAGVSRVDLTSFFWTTALGTLPADLAYTAAGREISRLDSTMDLLSPGVFAALVLLGLTTFLPKFLWQWSREKDSSGEELESG